MHHARWYPHATSWRARPRTRFCLQDRKPAVETTQLRLEMFVGGGLPNRSSWQLPCSDAQPFQSVWQSRVILWHI